MSLCTVRITCHSLQSRETNVYACSDNFTILHVFRYKGAKIKALFNLRFSSGDRFRLAASQITRAHTQMHAHAHNTCTDNILLTTPQSIDQQDSCGLISHHCSMLKPCMLHQQNLCSLQNNTDSVTYMHGCLKRACFTFLPGAIFFSQFQLQH